MQAIHPFQHLAACGLLIAAAAASGCATTVATDMPALVEEVSPALEPATPEYVPVVRYGRYTLVELAPSAAQRDLLLQVVDVAMPEDARATVGDGLRHALKRSGYQLCETAHATITLYALPLPAEHLHLGPLTLRDALLTLAGPAWDLEVDDRTRQVCFVRPPPDASEDPDTTTLSADGLATEAAQTFPDAAGGQP